MKKVFLMGAFAVALFTNTACGQNVPKNQVPSVVVNNFKQAFPKAFDVEWEIYGENYKVEFDTGLNGTDHDAVYDKTGKLVYHKEEISKSDLPQKVSAKISSDFGAYKVEDLKKITEGNKVTYILEVESATEEWKVTFDAEGNMLGKVAD